jgi:hypothetical protein
MSNPWLNEHKSTAAMNYFLINHGLGIYIRILSLSSARENIIEYKFPTCPWLNEHKSTATMNYFFSNMTNIT